MISSFCCLDSKTFRCPSSFLNALKYLRSALLTFLGVSVPLCIPPIESLGSSNTNFCEFADTRIAKIRFVTLICSLAVQIDPAESVPPVLAEDSSWTILQSTDVDEHVCLPLNDFDGEDGSISPDSVLARVVFSGSLASSVGRDWLNSRMAGLFLPHLWIRILRHIRKSSPFCEDSYSGMVLRFEIV